MTSPGQSLFSSFTGFFIAYVALATLVQLNQYSSICTGWRMISQNMVDNVAWESMDRMNFCSQRGEEVCMMDTPYIATTVFC